MSDIQRPAGCGIVVNGSLGLALLSVARLPLGDVLAAGKLDLAEEKIAIVRSSRSCVGQTIVRQRIDANGGDASGGPGSTSDGLPGNGSRETVRVRVDELA